MEVGTIQGSFEVSSLGSANYSIPLEIVPGTKGIQPQLLISYTNQTGRALLGHGWNLDGLSSISRSSQTTYYEGQKKEITLTNNDPLSLDGQRLLLMSGTAMTTGAIYRFEIEDYTRVYITNANSVSGPLTLEVRKNDGSIFYYGENNSCIKTNTGIAYQWRIHKSKDIYGNYIQYNYGNTNLANLSGESYIDNIQYTGNASAGIAPRNSIKFKYAISPTTKQYILGHEITNDLIITSIEVQQQNTTIRTYSFKYFKYSNSQFSLHLAEIHQSMQGK